MNGKPDLSGLWQAERTPASEFVRVVGLNVFWDMNPAERPLRPEAAALTEERQKSGRDFQAAYCLPTSLPAAMLVMNFQRSARVRLHGEREGQRSLPMTFRAR